MMKSKILTILIMVLISAVCDAHQNIRNSNDTLLMIMSSHLKPSGKNPVHSIQVYMSKGDSVFNEAVGYADGEKKLAEKDNQFKIASITKIMTSVVILQLQEEGKLNISDPIGHYLKDVGFARVNELHYHKKKPYGNSITIKQLLQHKSGIADIFTDAAFRFYLNAYFNKKRQWNPEKLMNRYYKYGLNIIILMLTTFCWDLL
jgi:D-alanyl-D-alanine carboxypeptidase